MEDFIVAWYLAHNSWHVAVANYNARVAFIRAQEAVSPDLVGRYSAGAEYADMNFLMRQALAADKTLYDQICGYNKDKQDGKG